MRGLRTVVEARDTCTAGGNNLKGFVDFDVRAKAMIWPELSDMCQIRWIKKTLRLPTVHPHYPHVPLQPLNSVVVEKNEIHAFFICCNRMCIAVTFFIAVTEAVVLPI